MLLCYWSFNRNYRNLVILFGSLFFYAWGEGIYVLLMLLSIGINYFCGRLIETCTARKFATLFFLMGVSLNLLLLLYFKYAHFLSDNVSVLLAIWNIPTTPLEPVRLPIGISFFTFQALSYLIDVYRMEVRAQRNFVKLAMYIALFPQLIAGPIVRYQTISDALTNRQVSLEQMTSGIERFMFGMSKKVLLANPMGSIADTVFGLPTADLTTPLAWLGAVCYTLQIYYDFSGYSDMAIGLGRMFGFGFQENFNYPYISRSVRDFWRRWHISLSTWLRDYVYFPLGGNRLGTVRTYVNLLFVFFLCGLWHGANWTFVVWGLYHGFFLILERTPLGALQQRIWVPLQIAATFMVVIVGWVVFRCDSLTAAIGHIGAMFGFAECARGAQPLTLYINSKAQFEMGMAFLLAMPIYPVLQEMSQKLINPAGPHHLVVSTHVLVQASKLLTIAILAYFSIISLAAGVYNPFIYFRF